MSEMKEINTLDLLSDLILMSKTFNNLMYKAELTMNDLITTRTQGHCSRKPSGLSYLSQISD